MRMGHLIQVHRWSGPLPIPVESATQLPSGPTNCDHGGREREQDEQQQREADAQRHPLPERPPADDLVDPVGAGHEGPDIP